MTILFHGVLTPCSVRFNPMFNSFQFRHNELNRRPQEEPADKFICPWGFNPVFSSFQPHVQFVSISAQWVKPVDLRWNPLDGILDIFAIMWAQWVEPDRQRRNPLDDNIIPWGSAKGGQVQPRVQFV